MKDYPPQKKKKKKKSFGSLPLPQSGYATTIMVFFAHLFLLIYSSQKVPTSLKCLHREVNVFEDVCCCICYEIMWICLCLFLQ